jgi:hypothetical protein
VLSQYDELKLTCRGDVKYEENVCVCSGTICESARSRTGVEFDGGELA